MNVLLKLIRAIGMLTASTPPDRIIVPAMTDTYKMERFVWVGIWQCHGTNRYSPIKSNILILDPVLFRWMLRWIFSKGTPWQYYILILRHQSSLCLYLISCGMHLFVKSTFNMLQIFLYCNVCRGVNRTYIFVTHLLYHFSAPPCEAVCDSLCSANRTCSCIDSICTEGM